MSTCSTNTTGGRFIYYIYAIYWTMSTVEVGKGKTTFFFVWVFRFFDTISNEEENFNKMQNQNSIDSRTCPW
jgi:hypothetical protein